MQARTYSFEDIDAVAAEVLLRLRAASVEGARVLAITGDLGAGKTSLMQGIGRALGVAEPVLSPTFVILKSYTASREGVTRLVHIDAYRVEDAEELRVLGFDAILKEKGAILAIEWAERVKELVPKDALWITLSYEEDGRRSITYHAD